MSWGLLEAALTLVIYEGFEGSEWLQLLSLWAGWNVADLAWNYATAEFTRRGDGFIGVDSQQYPDVPGTFGAFKYLVPADEQYRPDLYTDFVVGGDSHLGVTRSRSSWDRVQRALRERF